MNGYEPQEDEFDLAELRERKKKSKDKAPFKLNGKLFKSFSKNFKKFSAFSILLEAAMELADVAKNTTVSLNSSHFLDNNGNVISEISSVQARLFFDGGQQYYQLTITDNNGNQEWAIIKGENSGN